MELPERRERQARRLLRVCLRPLLDGCIDRYVVAYEGGTLKHGDGAMCALGTMSGGCYVQWLGTLGGTKIAKPHRHQREAGHIEAVFEGYGLFYRAALHDHDFPGFPSWLVPWHLRDCDEQRAVRRRWIYEACVEELARRGSRPPLPASVPQRETAGVATSNILQGANT